MGCLFGCDSAPLEVTNDDREVVVPDRYRDCSLDKDCVLTSISCDGCCQRDAVAKDQKDEFERDREESCDYSGAVCDCSFSEMRAICDEERCVAVELVVN
jgi:hypothetical protein